MDCGALAAGPAWKPRLEAAPRPGATSTNAATIMPTKASGPTPNSSTFISVPRPFPQVRVRPTDPVRLADRDGRRPIPRRAGVDGVAKGPAVGGPAGLAGYQPTVEPSSGSGTGVADEGVAGAGAGVAGAGGGGVGWGGGGVGWGGGGVGWGGGADGAPKLGGIPPGLAWSPKPPACWSPVERPSLPLTMAPSSPGVP